MTDDAAQVKMKVDGFLKQLSADNIDDHAVTLLAMFSMLVIQTARIADTLERIECEGLETYGGPNAPTA